MICEVCGNTNFRDGMSDQTFNIDGKLVLVEGIPCHVCDRCGEPSFDAPVAEQTRRIVRGPRQASRMIQAEVVDFRAA